VLKRTFGLFRKAIKGDRRESNNEELHTLQFSIYYSSDESEDVRDVGLIWHV